LTNAAYLSTINSQLKNSKMNYTAAFETANGAKYSKIIEASSIEDATIYASELAEEKNETLLQIDDDSLNP